MKNVGVLIFSGAEELDFVGPWEMITMWRKVAAGPERCLMVAQTMAPVICAKGMSVNPHESFDTCPQLDALLIPGGQGTRTEVSNPALIDFVRRQAAGCRDVLSICTGSFILHAAGLLDGRRATTHWESLGRLRALDGVEVVEDRWTRDGNVWTAAGVSAGIDLTLAWIADVAGPEKAGYVQLRAEYFPDGVLHGSCDSHPQAPGYARRPRRRGSGDGHD